MSLNSKWWFGFLTVTIELGTIELVLRGRFRTLTRRREGRESCTDGKAGAGIPIPQTSLALQALTGTSYEVHLVKAMVFPVVVTYGCESWNYKESWAPKNWTVAFELWCWRRLLRVVWTARRSNQSILKEISPEYSLEGLMLNWISSTLTTWFEELIHLKRPWCWERLRAVGEGDDRGWDGWMASLTQWTWVWVGSRSWWWTGRPGLLWFIGLKRVRHDWATELNWTELKQFGLWQWGAIKGFWAKWNMNVGFFENIYRAISLSRKTHPLSAVGKIILENFLRLKVFSFLIPVLFSLSSNHLNLEIG